jgi:hypothetical protein
MAITAKAAYAPRSRQTAIGLSEVGDPCSRKLAYKSLGTEKTNVMNDPWPAISGTAIHSYLAEVFASDANFLVEQRVTAAPGLAGTLDLYDIEQGLVIDHKCVGTNSMKARIKDGMTATQRVQLSMYALGLENEGHTPRSIACAYYPLGGRLDALHVVMEPYERQVALVALDRYRTLLEAVKVISIEQIPATPSAMCSYCSWFIPNSNDLSVGCPGQVDAA